VAGSGLDEQPAAFLMGHKQTSRETEAISAFFQKADIEIEIILGDDQGGRSNTLARGSFGI
jgi:hypothetical protein